MVSLRLRRITEASFLNQANRSVTLCCDDLDPAASWRSPMPFALSCKCQYALSALVELATSYASGQPLQSRQLASRQNIPDRYLEQLLATLKRGGLVQSQRGVNGGYLLAREPMDISILEVVYCIDGKNHDPVQQSSTPTIECAVINDVWQEAQESMVSVLKRYSLKDLMEKRDIRQHASVMYYI